MKLLSTEKLHTAHFLRPRYQNSSLFKVLFTNSMLLRLFKTPREPCLIVTLMCCTAPEMFLISSPSSEALLLLLVLARDRYCPQRRSDPEETTLKTFIRKYKAQVLLLKTHIIHVACTQICITLCQTQV